jgi:hypothetical protein
LRLHYDLIQALIAALPCLNGRVFIDTPCFVASGDREQRYSGSNRHKAQHEYNIKSLVFLGTPLGF